jgi:hypothetical protein
MAAQLQPGVRDRLEDPTPGERVTLIVGVRPAADTAAAVDAIEDAGGTVEEELFYDSLAVSIDEADLDALTDITKLQTVEIEAEWEQMTSDFRTPDSALQKR